MLAFKDIVFRGVQQYVDIYKDEEAEASDCFRGSNAPLLYNSEKFITDSADHCPRKAIARRLHLPTDHPKEIKSYNSHHYGRAMEELLKKLIIDAKVEGLTTAEEEGYAVKVQDENGNVIFSARPDLVLFYNGKPEVACEFKSVQSNSTAEGVFHKLTPKLGAAIQVAVQMHYHDIPKGLIAYMLGHWIQGYSFTTKKSFKLEPAIQTFDCEWNKEGTLLIEGKESIVTKQRVEEGLSYLNAYYQEGVLPPERPHSCDVWGNNSYSCCDYCVYGEKQTGICNSIEASGLKISNFKDLIINALGEKGQ